MDLTINYRVWLLFGLAGISGLSMAQTDLSKGIIVRGIVVGSDTVVVANIPDVYVHAPRKFKSKRDYNRYLRFVHNIKVAYPYAKLAAKILTEVNDHLATLKTDREKEAYLKKVEKELLGEYTDELKKLTITQGKILIKLIYRETDNTSFMLVKDYRGRFSAVFWQGMARLFGSNLKDSYDPAGEDRLMEEIVVAIEQGAL